MKHPAFVCCAVSFLFLGATSVQAQETSDLTDVHFYPPSAVSMMKYIDYPVSHRTGIPEISIPLYTVRSGSLELPVNLSFHLDDFTRVNQLAGAAGAGWSLSCDLQVSRIINGVDDLKTTGYLHTGVSKPDITSTTLVRSTTDRMRLLWRKGADEDPDRFYYKLLNGGGSFYIERELGPKTVPVTGDRIVFDELGTETFVITGTDGTIYRFSSAVADTATDSQIQPASKTAWKCTEIESADGGSSIAFSYLPYRSRVLQTPGSVSLYDRGELYTTNDEVRYAARYPREERYGSIIYSCTLLFGWDDEGYGPTNFFWKELPDQPENSSTVSKWVESHYIDRITFRGGYAQFEYEAYDDTRTRILNPVLERVVICATQGVARQTIVFTQSNVDQRYERYLQSVQIGNDTYSFSYGMQHIGDAIADFWGYGYRGHYSGGSADVPCHKVLLDLGTDPVDMYGDKLTYPGDYFQREFSMPSNSFPDEIYRTPDEEKRLLSITYPTGGRTEFMCDHNCFRDGEDAVRRISSYRIKYIRYYDTDDTLLKETAYKYGPDEDGCGVIRHEPDMDDDMGNCHTEQIVNYYYPRDSWSGSYSLGATLRLRTYYPHTIYRTNYDDGSHVQYDEVAEYQSAGGTLSGKTVYKYDLTNRHARPVREVFAYPNAPYPVEGDTWYLGQLDSVVQYKYDGGRFDWVARRAYTYNRYDASERIFCARVWASAVGYLLGGSQQIDDGHTFEYSYNGITPGCMQLSEEIIEQREDDGRILRRRTNYYYDTNPYTASRKETTYADGRTVTERTLYAEDYLPSSVQTMLDRNLLSLPLERVVYTDETVTHGDTFRYDLYGRLDSLSTLASLDLSPASFRFSNRSSTDGKGAYTPDTHYIGRASLRYDADGNICEVQAVGQPPICYLWGYKGQYLVAEIRNAAYDEVTTALGAATVERIRTSVVLSEGDLAALDGLRTSRKEWHVTTATYIPLVGMASMTDPSGRETTYEYDAFGRLISVKDGKGEQVQSYDYHFATENR